MSAFTDVPGRRRDQRHHPLTVRAAGRAGAMPGKPGPAEPFRCFGGAETVAGTAPTNVQTRRQGWRRFQMQVSAARVVLRGERPPARTVRVRFFLELFRT